MKIRKIYKYTLTLEDTQVVKMYMGAEILTAQIQNGILTLWAVIDPDVQIVNRAIHISGTGHPRNFIEIDQRNYIATVQDGGLVWHIFNGGEFDV